MLIMIIMKYGYQAYVKNVNLKKNNNKFNKRLASASFLCYYIKRIKNTHTLISLKSVLVFSRQVFLNVKLEWR